MVTKTKQYKDLSESVNVKTFTPTLKILKKENVHSSISYKTQALMYQWYAFILFSEMMIDNDNLLRLYEFNRKISRKIFL